MMTRAVDKVFRFVRLAEFEILFVLFFLIAFILFKDLVSPHPISLLRQLNISHLVSGQNSGAAPASKRSSRVLYVQLTTVCLRF
jgi:hypothetical protein